MTGIGLILALWAIATADHVASWDSSFTQLVQSGPSWVESLLSLGYLLSMIHALAIIGALVLGGRERREALRDIAIVAIGTTALVVLLSQLINGTWPYFVPEVDLQNPVAQFPVARVAVVTAILICATPFVTRPLKFIGWFAVLVTSIAAVGLEYGTVRHTIGSFGVGLFSAGLLLLIVGSPKGYPEPDSVAAGLRLLGAESSGIALAKNQTWGAVRFTARGDGGKPLDIKVLGRDAADSQRAARLWRTLWYREMSRTASHSRLQTVEHEALTTMMAARAGVKVPELVAVGNPTSEIALIALEIGGVTLAEVEPSSLTDQFLVGLWRDVQLMHDHSISHGRLSTAAIRVDSDDFLITDFAYGSLAPDDASQSEDAMELLFSLALIVGPERAARSAFDGLGRDSLIEKLPYLQLPAISATSRRLAENPKKVMSGLVGAVLALTETEAPEPVKLRRVTLRNLITAALLLLVAFALVPLFTNVDYAEIWAVLQTSDWTLMVAALLVGQTQFLPSAASTMFAVSVPLPFWPLVTLQTAAQFVSLAIPSSAGRIAMNTAFLHKFGLSVTSALTQGAIDGFSGFIVQALILLFVFLTGDVSLNIDTSSIPWLLILGIVVLIIIGAVITILRVQKLRDRIVPILAQSWDALAVVVKQPSRAIGLLVSSFIYWNILGMTLWLLLEAVGAPLDYGSALFVVAGTSLFAGFMPVPGGVGVAEATMTAILATFGVDSSAAFAATAVYRVITFYLPALEGLFGMRWLERNEYI
ncbi:MAG TPA: lysylphosphatidylglycerol synthase transmembrane domain-containing protein [Acidimicrobiia bacterium]